jgi:large subunit ribosomal protein L21
MFVSAKYAIVNVFGRQFRVQEGQSIKASFCENAIGDSLVFPEVLLVSDGASTRVGAPLVQGAKVTAKVASHGRDPKILVFKHLTKNKHKKKLGHKQPFSTLTIDRIEG